MSSLFWVNWVARESFDSIRLSKGERVAHVSGYSSPQLTLEKAIEGAKFKENLPDTILVWIEEHDEDGRKIGIPYLKSLVDAFGYRKEERK